MAGVPVIVGGVGARLPERGPHQLRPPIKAITVQTLLLCGINTFPSKITIPDL